MMNHIIKFNQRIALLFKLSNCKMNIINHCTKNSTVMQLNNNPVYLPIANVSLPLLDNWLGPDCGDALL